MLRLLFGCFMLFAQIAFAQVATTAKISNDPPFTAVKTAYGSVLRLGEYALIFRDVLEDSRC